MRQHIPRGTRVFEAGLYRCQCDRGHGVWAENDFCPWPIYISMCMALPALKRPSGTSSLNGDHGKYALQYYAIFVSLDF